MLAAMRIVARSAFFVLATGALLACGGPQASDHTETASAPHRLGTPITATDTESAVYHVIAVKVVDPDHDLSAAASTPTGARYVSVVFSLTGVSGGNLGYAADYFVADAALIGTDGQEYRVTPITSSSGINLVNDLKLAPGQTVTRVATFLLPSAARLGFVQWTWLVPKDSPSGLGSKTARWLASNSSPSASKSPMTHRIQTEE